MTEVHRYRRRLPCVPVEALCPKGILIVPIEPASHARSVHRLLEEGYRDGGGQVPSFDAWWSDLINDAEYDPDLVFLVADRRGGPLAVAICWTSAFVKDLVVATSARRQGLTSVLLHHAFQVFQARAAEHVDLKVEAGNEAAISLYRSVGMVHVETLWLEE